LWASHFLACNGLLTLANKGDADAQYHVGMMYNNGIGTAQDTKQAFGRFQKSAAAHDPLGAYKLGCYYAGQGVGVVVQDEAEALNYKLVAAEAGYSPAQHDVAVVYAQRGNFEAAVKWLKLANDHGYDRAVCGLSSSYHEGKGVPQDLTQALAHYKLSMLVADAELTDSSKAVLDEMIARMSDAELAKAQKIFLEWKPQPTALTIKASGGIAEAEEYLERVKE
jgi:uncharacterized protein